MNGRVYDPKLGRFLQADPFIQEADNTQSYNRYSYVINNPLNATDPSGFIFDKIGDFFKKFAGKIVTAVVTIYCQVCGPIVAGMLGGAVDAAVNGGNIIKGAVAGMFSGAVAQFASVQVGGGNFGASDNNFSAGFLAAGLLPDAQGSDDNRKRKGANADTLRLISRVTEGGTGTDQTGDKFVNGAGTAALAQAVNGRAAQTREHNRRADTKERRLGPITKALAAGNAVFSISNVVSVLQAREAIDKAINRINDITENGSPEQQRELAKVLGVSPNLSGSILQGIALSPLANARQEFQRQGLIQLVPEVPGLIAIRFKAPALISFGLETANFTNSFLTPVQGASLSEEEAIDLLLR